MNDIRSRIKYALDLQKTITGYSSVAMPLSVIIHGDVFVGREEYDQAMKIRNKAWEIFENMGDEAITKDSLVVIASKVLLIKILKKVENNEFAKN